MKTIHNILTKIFLILALGVGWGSTASATPLMPKFDGTYYYIKFTNQSCYMYDSGAANISLTQTAPSFTGDDRYMWKLEGAEDNFVLVNRNGKYLKLTGSGGDNGFYQLGDGSDGAAHLMLDTHTGDANVWEIKNIDLSSGRVHMNPRLSGNAVSHWDDNDNGNRVIFEAALVLKTSSAPVGDAWSADTHWYTMNNVRAANNGGGYVGTEGKFVDNDGNLKLRVSGKPEGKSGQWAFVPTGDGSYYIYNRAKGAGYVMGTINNQPATNAGNAATRSKMYEGTGDEENVTKTYTLGVNSDGFWICLTGTNKHLDDGSSAYLTVWDHASNPKSSEGNRFILTEANPSVDLEATYAPAAGATVSSLTTVTIDFSGDAYTVADATGIAGGTVQAMPVLRRRSDNVVVATATAVSSTTGGEPYTITFAEVPAGDYTLVIPEGTFYAQVDGEWTPVSDMSANYDIRDFLDEVTLKFVDAAGNTLSGASVVYTPANGDAAVTLSAAESPYDFNNTEFDASCFTSGSSDYTFGAAKYDKATNTLSFILSPHTIPTGVYRMSFSTQDRGTIIDINQNYTTLGRNAWQTTGTVATNANSLWYVSRQNDGTYVIASLSTYAGRGEDIYYLKGAQTNTFSVNTLVPWTFTYMETLARGKGNGKSEFFGGYDTTIPTPDYFEIRPNSWATNQFLAGSPGYGEADRVRPGSHEVAASYIEFCPVSETEITDPEQVALLNRIKSQWVTLDGPVTLRFVDENDQPTTICNVTYHPSNGDADVELAATETSYTFSNEQYIEYLAGSLFSISMDGYNLKTSYDVGTNTLTFKITVDPNFLQFSAAPINGEWAEGTKWFTWRNNRPEGGSNPALRYISTSKYFVKNHMYIENFGTGNASADRGGMWCFVGDENGFQIQNAAYGPDFVFAYVNNNGSARFEMVLKDELPTGATATFTYLPCGAAGTGLQSSGFLDGANYGYVFRIGTTGNNQVHSNSSGVISWDGGGRLRYDDGGSVFKVTAVSDAELEALQAYDVYRVNTVGVPGYSNIDYNNELITFGRRSTAKNGDFLIINAGTVFAPTDFTVTPSTEYDVIAVETSEDPTHYYKHLELDLHDHLATDVYTIVVTNGTADAYDVDAVNVYYYGRHHVNGETIYARPNSVPNTAEFRLSCEDDKFIWGPVIDTKAKTVTFDIRDRVTTFHTGLYQLMLKGDANITKANNFIVKYDENINTPSRYLYIAPSIHKEDNTVFKYTGVPTYAEEPTTYIYIEENGAGRVNISAAGGAAFNNLAYTFDATAGEITFTDYGINGYTKQETTSNTTIYEPREMPSFISGTGPTTYALTPISMTAYDAYRISYDGTYTAQTRVRYGKTTPTGVSNYGLDDLFIVNKGYTSFLPSDFSPTDARCMKVEIISPPTDVDPGELRLTLDVPVREFTLNITGDAATPADRIIYNGEEYTTGSTVIIAGASVDPTSVKTNVTDRFVWGPVIDEDFRTVTFDIRSAQETTLTPGWYQMQLVNKTGDVYNGSWKSGVDLVEEINKMANIPFKGSYIYPYGANNTNSWTMGITGVPANETMTYVYVAASGETDKPYIMMQNGYFYNITTEATASPTKLQQTWLSASHSFQWESKDLSPWAGLFDSKPGIGVGTGHGKNSFIYHPVDVKAYQIKVSGGAKVTYVGDANILNDKSSVTDSYIFFLPADEDFERDGEGHILSSIFNLDRGVITGIAEGDNGHGVATITIQTANDALEYMIIHRQHDVYDRIAAISHDLLPDDNHIKRGGGFIPQPYVKDLDGTVVVPNPAFNSELPESTDNPKTLTRTYYANDRHMQNTSVFRVTQYTAPGTSTGCVLPFTRDKNNGGLNKYGHVAYYQRWYDYTTERCLSDDILSISGFYKFTNGLCNYGVNNSNLIDRLKDTAGSTNVTLPAGRKEVYVAVDASEFDDGSIDQTNHNLTEPSLNMRVIYHIVSAHEMAKQLTTSGDKWWEEREYIVPNVKRGSDTYHNNADLIPIVMPWTNYWFYKTAGTVGEEQADDKLMPLVAENGNYNTLRSNIRIAIEGTAADGHPMEEYLEVGVLDGNPGQIGTVPYISSNHHLYYKIKGSGVTRVVPAGSEAVIKVYAKNGSATADDPSPEYQLFKFTLKFQADSEPLAITDVIGNAASTRSVDYFVSKNYEEVANMTFQQKDVAFTKIKNHRNDNNEAQTYAFPIDFERTSYGYSPSYTFGNYSITRQGYGIKYYPVTLYERNIKNPGITSMDIKDDYFFYIDASETPGQVAAVKFDGNLCAGSRLYCYGWLGSGNHYNLATGANVVLRLIGVRKEWVDGEEQEVEYPLASYLPGQLSDVSYDSKGNVMRSLAYARTPSMEPAIYMTSDARQTGVWNSIGFSFTLGNEAYDRYEMRILNNCISTSGGDYSLDDFRVFVAPAKASVEYVAPVCFDHIPLLKVTMPRNAVQGDPDAEGNAKISYCFLDKEKYQSALDDAMADHVTLSHADYNAAFNAALIGNRIASDDINGVRSFWNITVPKTDEAYNALRAYDFSKIISETDGYLPNGIYRQTVGANEEIVISSNINKADGWEDNRDYLIALTQGHVTTNFATAGVNSFNIASEGRCHSFDEFKLKPSLTINSDIPELTVVPASACEGQVSTISVDMHGYGPLGSVVLKNMAYDWWIGYGKPNATDPAEKADVHDFDQQEFGGVLLRNALEHFRAFYPDAFEAESYEPKTGEVAGQTVTYSDADKACILHFLEPGANGRVPLVLGSRILNVNTVEADAVVEDGQKYIYFTVLPIRPDEAYDADQNVIFCPDPQQGKIKIEEYAPKMIDGFTGMHSMYPESMTNVPVRMGLRQIDAVRLDTKGNMGDYHLRVPLRGIAKSPQNKENNKTFIGKYKRKKLVETEAQSFNDFLTLVYTDDPLYFDRMILDVDAEGNMQLITVGRVEAYNAPTEGDAHMEIGFARDFRPREGYTYTLKAFFEEDVDADPTAYKPCPGSLIFDLKVVPEYAQWTAAEGNTDWTNDGNWARADRDVLNADNATSERVNKGDAAHPFAGYQTNTANYSSDPRYKVSDDASAHVFTPMYFTNVLMHDAQLRAPEIYTHTAPVAGSSFLGGLHEATATKFIEYDMLATPISETGSWSSGKTMTPLALAQRYGNYATNFGCELFWSNVCDGLTFEPATMMYDAQNLLYNKAWVEYELKTGRWYTLASPLQDTYAGEWYSPEAGGRQLTPHFYAIKYNEALNDRFNPAYYQRSWDKAGKAWIYRMSEDEGTYLGFEHDTQNADVVRVQKPTYLNWSYVYNDVTVPYSQGGFSVNVRYTDQGQDATDSKALVRMPKDDASYLYYQSEASAAVDSNGQTQNPDSSDADAGVARPNGVASGDYTEITRTTHHRLMSDLLLDASGNATTISQSILNASASNPYYLVGNPLMAPLDMDKFFQQNTQFVDNKDDQNPNGDGRKYWIMDNGLQTVSIKVNDKWISTTADGGVVAPLQGFFVRVATDENGQAEARPANGMQVKYTAEMQKPITADVARPSLRAPRRSDAQPGIFRIDATNDGQMHSTAIVYFSEQASNRYVASEDAETLLDGNIADKVSTVFTAADEQALSINSMSTAVTTIPLGVIAPKDDTRTTLRFSGISQLEAVMEGTPHLYDAANDTFEVLEEGSTFSVTGTTAGRYFIVCGTTLPFTDEADENAEDEYDGKVYNLHGIRVATPQHGTVTIRGSRKEYSK